MLLFRKNKKKPTTTVHTKVDFDHLPRHVAIIMDGNGRWAKKRGLPRTAGHAAGAETFRTIATYCKDIGLEYLTVYAFSTENWKRPAGGSGGHHGPAAQVSARGHRRRWRRTRSSCNFSAT